MPAGSGCEASQAGTSAGRGPRDIQPGRDGAALGCLRRHAQGRVHLPQRHRASAAARRAGAGGVQQRHDAAREARPSGDDLRLGVGRGGAPRCLSRCRRKSAASVSVNGCIASRALTPRRRPDSSSSPSRRHMRVAADQHQLQRGPAEAGQGVHQPQILQHRPRALPRRHPRSRPARPCRATAPPAAAMPGRVRGCGGGRVGKVEQLREPLLQAPAASGTAPPGGARGGPQGRAAPERLPARWSCPAGGPGQDHHRLARAQAAEQQSDRLRLRPGAENGRFVSPQPLHEPQVHVG